jgi:hypothetical protein
MGHFQTNRHNPQGPQLNYHPDEPSSSSRRSQDRTLLSTSHQGDIGMSLWNGIPENPGYATVLGRNTFRYRSSRESATSLERLHIILWWWSQYREIALDYSRELRHLRRGSVDWGQINLAFALELVGGCDSGELRRSNNGSDLKMASAVMIESRSLKKTYSLQAIVCIEASCSFVSASITVCQSGEHEQSIADQWSDKHCERRCILLGWTWNFYENREGCLSL